MIKRAACLAVAMWATAPANASECADEHLQAAADRYFAVDTPNASFADIAEALRQDVNRCYKDPWILRLSALAHARMAALEAARDLDAALPYAGRAYSLLDESQRLTPNEPRTRQVNDSKGDPVSLHFNDNVEVSKAIIDNLLSIEARAGRVAPFNGPPAPGASYGPCDSHSVGNALHASNWIREHGDSEGGWNMLQRAVTGCPRVGTGRWTEVYAAYANALLSEMRRDPGGPSALTQARVIFSYSDAITKEGGGDPAWPAYRHDAAVSEVWRVLIAQNYTLPKEEWFASHYLNGPLANMSIALALDAAYAADQDRGSSEAALAHDYRAVISDAYAVIKAMPDDAQKREARLSLYTAATKHAEGEWRRDANKQLSAPTAVMYAWIDPDHEAAATPAPQTPPTQP